MVLPAAVSMPLDVLARLMVWADLGEPHLAIAGEPQWLPDDEADEQARAAREHAWELGLLDRRGRVDVEVAASLAVLCRAHKEFFGWLHSGDRTVGVLAGAIGTEAVLAIADEQTVWLSKTHSGRLPETLVAQTADVPPGRGDSVRVRRSATPQPDGYGRVRNPRMEFVERIAALPAKGGGELHVAVRDRMGRHAHCARPLGYTDTANGRWLHHPTPMPGGDEKVEIAPASRAELARRLRRMHEALVHDR